MTIITTTKEMRPRDPNDFYPTPTGHVRAALDKLDELLPQSRPAILDPGAGSGVWGNVAREKWRYAHITGVELRPVEPPDANSYDEWHVEDYRLWERPLYGFDYVIGNPPYKYAEHFVRLGLNHLSNGGVMCYLLRLAFLEGQDRGRDLWLKHPPMLIQVCSERPSFTGDGHTDATAYAMFYWQKGWRGETKLSWMK